MSYERSPASKARYAKKLRRQEKRWAAKSGPVTIRHLDDLPPAERARYRPEPEPADRSDQSDEPTTRPTD